MAAKCPPPFGRSGIVMRKRVKLNSYEPLVHDKNMKFVTRSWYNKIFPFVKPFEFLKRNKFFQCWSTRFRILGPRYIPSKYQGNASAPAMTPNHPRADQHMVLRAQPDAEWHRQRQVISLSE